MYHRQKQKTYCYISAFLAVLTLAPFTGAAQVPLTATFGTSAHITIPQPPSPPLLQLALESSAKPDAKEAKKDAVAVKDASLLQMGWVEMVSVGKNPFLMKAKLDSGAKTSSIHADVIKTYKKGDQEYILFRIYDHEGESKTLRSIIRRHVRIKLKDKEDKYIRRPVVELDFCLGTRPIRGEVNLADRDHFIYDVLVGRNMLKNNILLDASKTYTHMPDCK